MPDRGKERDGTDGIMLPSNLLLCREQTAATHGHTGDTAPDGEPCLGSCPGFWAALQGVRESNGHAEAGNGVSLCSRRPGADLLAALQSLASSGVLTQAGLKCSGDAVEQDVRW